MRYAGPVNGEIARHLEIFLRSTDVKIEMELVIQNGE